MSCPHNSGRFILRAAVITAACIVILCGAASAFGFDILQAFADWTAETFGFVTPGQEEAEAPQDDPFLKLRLAVAEESSIAAVPNWYPQGTKVDEDLKISYRSNGTSLQALFSSGQGTFTIRYQIYDTIPETYVGIYQKDANQLETYNVNGISHYIMKNNETHSVAWTNGNIEGHIQGLLSVDDLKKMVDSIYEE